MIAAQLVATITAAWTVNGSIRLAIGLTAGRDH
jgi:hypothetical protein